LILRGCNPNPTIEAVAPEVMPRRVGVSSARPPYVPGLLMVKFRGTGTEPEVLNTLERIRATKVSPHGIYGYFTYRIPQGSNPVVAAALLAATRGVADAEPMHALYPLVVPNDQWFGPPPPYTGPDTTHVQWDMYYTQMPSAWDIAEGSPSIHIAVIDTGYDANNIDICSKVDDSAVFDNTTGVQDTATTAQDDDGHGSDVSGIAASVTNNSTRFAGVGWNVDLFEVRVFKQPTATKPNPDGATPLDVAAAINWAVSRKADVINLSLGSPPNGEPCNAAEQAAINNAVNNNIVVVVASGNDSSNLFGDPANCSGIIVVGASALDDTTNPSTPVEVPAPYSNYNSNSSWGIVAPGGNPTAAEFTMCQTTMVCDYLQWITNAWSTTACCANSNPPDKEQHWVPIYGTSMAAPHVAGVVALMISKYGAHPPVAVATRLMSTADSICSCFQQGAGRLNAANALAASP
jgi:subtilisin family serine protease